MQVSGVVTSADDGQPLPGVSVVVLEAGLGTITDTNGRYSLSNVPADANLRFTFMGMSTQNIAVGGRQVIDVELHLDAHALDELVVTALGISRERRSVGYAMQEVKGDQLTNTPQGDLNNTLVGRIAGVRYWGASGATFDAGRIVLRGTSSLTNPGGDEPIYVVDGVITNVNVIDMNNVESVNVLKGPAATAIYGSRGGNGAVIITSRRPEPRSADRGVVEIRQSFAWEKVDMIARYQTEYGGGLEGTGNGDRQLRVFNFNPAVHPSHLSVLDGVRWYQYAEDYSWGARFDGQPYAPWYAWDPQHPKFGQTAPYVGQPSDNLKDLFQTGFSSTTSVAFSRTIGDFSTRVSFGNTDRSGVMETSKAVRRFLSVHADYKVTDRLSITADYRYTYRRNYNAMQEGYGDDGNRGLDMMYAYTQWFQRDVDINELRNYKRPDGTFFTWNPADVTSGDVSSMFFDGPFALMHEIGVAQRLQWNVFSSTVKFDVIKNMLSVGVSGNANIRAEFADAGIPYHLNGLTPMYALEDNQLFDTQMQAFVQFGNRFMSDRLDLSARLYVEQRDRDYRRMWANTTDGLTSDRFFNLAASVGRPDVSNRTEQLKERSIFGAGTVGWDGTYYLDFSLRNDWSSTLPANDNSYLYGGLSAAIITSNFLQSVNWLDFWKIRASIAQVGSTMSPYQTEQVYVSTPKYGNVSAMRGARVLSNPNIRPTISTSYEFGTEFRLYNGRVYGDINYYHKDSKDQIINLTVTPATGFTTTRINAGKIQNKGYEISLGVVPVRTNDFEWDVYFNWAANKNKLIELDPNDPENTQYRLTWLQFYNRIISYAEVGQPIGVIRGSTFEYSPDGQIVFNRLADGHWAGDGQHRLDQTSTALLGNVQPDATGGFGTSLRWKSLRLDMAFDYQIGGDVGSVTNMFGRGTGQLASTVGNNDKGNPMRDKVADGGGVKIEGVTLNADGTYDPFSGYLDAREYFFRNQVVWGPNMYKASYLKMREIALTWQVSNEIMQRLNVGLSRASVSFNVQNPWLIYSGVPNIDASAISRSFGNFLEMGQTFNTRTFACTLNLTF